MIFITSVRRDYLNVHVQPSSIVVDMNLHLLLSN